MECDFAGKPFTSMQGLRKHQAKYHMISVDLAIPLQIRSLATKSIPPLRRKTQRLGIRELNVGLTPAFNTRSAAHQGPQTIREYAAAPNDLNLTNTSERNDTDAPNSADLVSTSCAESGIAHTLESGNKLKPVHFPRLCSMSEASLPIGEPMQTVPETSHDDSPRIDTVVKSRQESNTSNKNTTKAIEIVHVEDSTESTLRFEDVHSEGQSVESCVSHYVQLAAKVHLENHEKSGRISTEKEAQRIKGSTTGQSPDETQPEWNAVYSCFRSTCWSNFIGSYIDATFADENAIPGISKRDIRRKLTGLICGIGSWGGHIQDAFLQLRTKFLPQEMIRFERAMSHYGDAGTDLRTFKDKLRLWGPQCLKDYVEESLRTERLGVDERDVYDWLYSYIREYSYEGSYLYLLTDVRQQMSWVQERRKDAYPSLWGLIFEFLLVGDHFVSLPLNIEGDQLTHYILFLLCKERSPAEMVESLKEYLKPSE